jgi:hypothetical protein
MLSATEAACEGPQEARAAACIMTWQMHVPGVCVCTSKLHDVNRRNVYGSD